MRHDGLVVPSDGRDVAPHGRFLFGIDMSGNLHLADVADSDVLHTNLLGVSSAGTPNGGVCFGEIQTDEFGRVSVINNRSGHTLPGAVHLEYALSLPVFAELDPEARVESYAGQDDRGNAIINEHLVADFR